MYVQETTKFFLYIVSDIWGKKLYQTTFSTFNNGEEEEGYFVFFLV